MLLKCLPVSDVEKIPMEYIETFKMNSDKNYYFTVTTEDIQNNFKDKYIHEETKAILAVLFRDYWANSNQRDIILEKENNERKEKYSMDNLFKSKQKKQYNYNNVELVEHKDSILIKLIKFIKNKLRM